MKCNTFFIRLLYFTTCSFCIKKKDKKGNIEKLNLPPPPWLYVPVNRNGFGGLQEGGGGWLLMNYLYPNIGVDSVGLH